MLSFILAAVIVQIGTSLVGSIALAYEHRLWLGYALALLIALPIPALIARRCHDQDRTAKWALLAVFAFAVWAARSVVSLVWGYEARIAVDGYTWMLDLLATGASLATLVLLFLPGTTGPNRFGPDPRVRE